MKKLCIQCIFVLWFLWLFPWGIAAHPLDVSNTTLSIYHQSIAWVTYIHPVELDKILVQSGGVNPNTLSIQTYYTLTGILTQYLRETIQVKNHGKYCTMQNFSFQEDLMIDEIFSWGFPISYQFNCEDPISDPDIHITFCNNIPLQTNRLYIYAPDQQGEMKRADYRVLNQKKSSHIFLRNELKSTQDSDQDGLSDEDEVLYGTNPTLSDSDRDGYNDMQEIQNSWNPLSKELSPGQKPYTWEEDQSTKTSAPGWVSNHSLSTDTTIWWWTQFQKILRQIRLYIDNSDSWWWLLLLMISAGILGFFHALGPWHSKGILIAQVVEKHISIRNIFFYSLTFSVVHILDILIVILISRVFFHYIDPSQYLATIQKWSIFLLIIIGSWLLIRSIRQYLWRREEDTSRKTPSHILLAIISGITPCAFWWSIFLMLLATKRIDLAFPLLISLGIGIFICLLGIWIITFLLQRQVYRFSPRIALFSPIISSSFIFLIGFWLLLQTFPSFL